MRFTFMIKCALHVLYLYLYNYLLTFLLSPGYFILTTIMILLFLTVFIVTHPVNFPCGRKPEQPEKTHDFRQNADWPFSSDESEYGESNPGSHSEEKGACSEDCANYMDDVLWKNEKRRWRILLQKYFAWIWYFGAVLVYVKVNDVSKLD
jgi:predicted nucleic acid-binding Zn ribbon protein